MGVQDVEAVFHREGGGGGAKGGEAQVVVLPPASVRPDIRVAEPVVQMRGVQHEQVEPRGGGA